MRGVTHILWLDEGPGKQPFGGAENHILVLLPALVRLGVDVELLVLLWRPGPLLDRCLQDLRNRGVRVTILQVRTKRTPRWFGLRFPEHLSMLRVALRERRDRIIHVHLDFFVTPVAARLAGCQRVVHSIHNDEQWFSRPWARVWLRFLDRRITHYVAISDRVRKHYMAQAGIPPRKITRIYYGLDLPSANETAEGLRPRMGIPPDRYVVGFTGRLTFQKNPLLFVEAIKSIPEAYGIMLGEGDLGGRVREAAAAAPNLKVLGYLPNAAEVIRCFDLFCLPSRYEGLGLVLLEAMTRKVPIVGSRAGAIPEILRDGEYGLLFEPGDLGSLTDTIRFAMKNRPLMREMAERAFEYARKTFSVDTMVSETVRVYGLVSSPRTGFTPGQGTPKL